MEQNIVVLGGSFNPPTIAHLKIMQAALDRVDGEKGYFVPVSHAYLKRKMMKNSTGQVCLSDSFRMQMLDSLCREDSRLEVSNLELKEIQSVTYRTMDAVSGKHPDARCFFLAGADKLELIAHWAESSDFLDRFGVILFSRGDTDARQQLRETEVLDRHRDAFVLLEQPEGLAGISSTAVRNCILSGVSAQAYVCPGVWQLLKNMKAEDFPEEICRFRGEYEFLSNKYPARVQWEGVVYPSAEAAFRAAQTPEWEEHQLAAMEEILRIKFRDPVLRGKLLATGNAVLIAGGYGKDLYWGMDLYSWVGENQLGKLLMKLREESL